MRRMTVKPGGAQRSVCLRSGAPLRSSVARGRSSLGSGASLRRTLVTALLVLAALALYSVPAQALSQRGHEFVGSFGESGEPASPSKPSALAVNEATGDVYVLEAENNRVVVYGPAPKHEFLEAWGYGVSNGEKKLETCTESANRGSPASARKGSSTIPSRSPWTTRRVHRAGTCTSSGTGRGRNRRSTSSPPRAGFSGTSSRRPKKKKNSKALSRASQSTRPGTYGSSVKRKKKKSTWSNSRAARWAAERRYRRKNSISPKKACSPNGSTSGNSPRKTWPSWKPKKPKTPNSKSAASSVP